MITVYVYCLHPLPLPPLLRRALRTAECIVMLLGQVAVTVWEQHGVIATVVAIFQQRLFHPVCSLDGNIVIELGKMAAKTGVHYLYVALFLGPAHFTVLKATESWAGPGNEANLYGQKVFSLMPICISHSLYTVKIQVFEFCVML